MIRVAELSERHAAGFQSLPLVHVALCIAVALAVLPASRAQDPAPGHARDESVWQGHAWEDPAHFVGAESCGECHVSEFEVWRRTPHATGFKTLHRKENAETIAGKMGFRLIKRGSLCIRCHYSPTEVSDQLRAREGVSCESCHGGGRDWIDLHNDYGGKGVQYQSESAQHRERRIADSVAAGMRRPSLLYDVARSCYSCHLVPEEELVNKGGHGTGSGGFELVSWSQGEIRHNFLAAQRGGDESNRQRSRELKRVMYVVGRAVELESAVRGVARATTKGTYLKAMQRRARIAAGELREIASRAELPGVAELLRTLRGVKVDLGQKAALLAAADRMTEIGRGLAVDHDGSLLASLDVLVEGEADATGDLEPDETAVELAAGAEVDLPPPPGSPGEPASTTGESGAAASTTVDPGAAADPSRDAPSRQAAGESRAPRTEAIGQLKRRIHPASRHRTLGSECSSCHAPQNEWWFDHEHYASADPFFDRDPKNTQIARLYGIKPSEMSRGDQICMDCHGTIVSGRERREVQDGVGCESCHGPAGDYLEAHQEGERAQGESRPGYLVALEQGMLRLRDLDVRAQTCSSCHYITEPRLISAGHPTGLGFDYQAGMASVRHWERGPAPPAALRAAFEGALGSRGGVPDVPVAQLASADPGAGRSAAELATGRASSADPFTGLSGTRAATGAEDPVFVPPPRARPASSSSAVALPEVVASDGRSPVRKPPTLSEFPEVDESTSVEDLLLLVKRRLDELHRQTNAARRPQ